MKYTTIFSFISVLFLICSLDRNKSEHDAVNARLEQQVQVLGDEEMWTLNNCNYRKRPLMHELVETRRELLRYSLKLNCARDGQQERKLP
jgi:hypothetical protein